ncbi:MAG TPA: cupin domain-containing protein [Acidimicrobiales bacterium]|nr:cupin domain-containing protein [Acidimicrobiales bacterium]
MDDPVFELSRFPVHLGRGARVVPLPEMDGSMAWFERYAAEHAADGDEGRLVTMFSFTEPWDSWEVHPHGEELVLCVSGSMTLHQELADGTERTVELSAGEAAVNPPGAWHTADVSGSATALFITSGRDTGHRPR